MDGNSRPLSWERAYPADALGSTLALTDSTGAIHAQYGYEPFGNTTIGGTSSTNPYQFTGRENDGTGLYFYRNRYYSPGHQTFTSQDPAGTLSSGSNSYTYAAGDPTSFVDPLGLYTCFYSQSTHTLVCFPDDPGDPVFESSDFASGAPGPRQNNPECQTKRNKGPIPQDDYIIGSDLPGHKSIWRSVVPPMWPPPFGRTGFLLHPSGKNEGCIMSRLNSTGDLLYYLLELEEGHNRLHVIP